MGVAEAIVGAPHATQVDGWIDAASITLVPKDLDEIDAAIEQSRFRTGDMPAGDICA